MFLESFLTVHFFFRTILYEAVVLDVSGGALFGMSCEGHQEQLSEWSHCIIPHGDLADAVSNFLKSVKDYGCKVTEKKFREIEIRKLNDYLSPKEQNFQLPPRKVIKFGLNFLRNHSSSYLEHPLYKRVTTQNCGKCGRRIRCCKFGFILCRKTHQDSRSRIPSICQEDHLWHTLLAPKQISACLQEMYPDAVAPLDGCNVSGYVAAELASLSRGPAYQYVEPLLCQILGTRIPAVNCARYCDKCHCCCFAYSPQPNGECVLASSSDPTTHCPSSPTARS
ncbi:unnamed protein product [Gongylonema pulchrum]|uniref:MYND-type domain-containing protein n=1 Tax=Gongylonema pulchrum TaxID=637853 RepID=A0A183DVI7_9BILA|nr:unnamed protein product [Gongylonema pulchrum]